jgi:hypothetical protein
MLNELISVERGARQAGIELIQRHPDVQDAGRMAVLLVQLGEQGDVVAVKPIPQGVTPWTLRKGNHDSFPFVQLKNPLWKATDADTKAKTRAAILELSHAATFPEESFVKWPGKGMLKALKAREASLQDVCGDAKIVPETISRFLRARGDKPRGQLDLLRSISDRLTEGLELSAQDEWLDVAVALLIGKRGALLFEASGYELPIYHPSLIPAISEALIQNDSATVVKGACALTGMKTVLLTGNAPQTKLPLRLGPTYLFAKNKNIDANMRYGLTSTSAMPVGREEIMRLDAALRALVSVERKNITWVGIPGKAAMPDLLLAFVEGALDAPVAEALVAEDFSEELDDSDASNSSIATFEKRTGRLIETVRRGRARTDIRATPVNLIVIRKLDQGNGKIAYAEASSVEDLHAAAQKWTQGERNVPGWLKMTIAGRDPRRRTPPHVAPLGLIAFSKKFYIRGGRVQRETVGVSAAESLRVFLVGKGDDRFARGNTKHLLRLVLSRRSTLVSGAAHATHARRDRAAKDFDNHEALRTVTILGVLLHKLNRGKEDYMNEAAFKLGQLLSAADVLHAGYCADVRGGDLPPSLLGNQVFVMAQSAPNRALAVLCRRWKPYDGWAKKTARDTGWLEKLVKSENKNDTERGWAIRKALRQAREIRPLAADLAPMLEDCRVDDSFRAELLLGYIAGLPPAKKEAETEYDLDEIKTEQEA